LRWTAKSKKMPTPPINSRWSRRMNAGLRRLLLIAVTLLTLATAPLFRAPGAVADACNPEAPPGNYGLDLDGQTSYVDLGAAPGLGSTTFTLEAWILRQGPGLAVSTGEVSAIPILTRGRDEAASEGNNLDLNWFLGLREADGVLVADFEDETTGANHPVAGTTPILPGAWTHVAAAYDGGVWTLYVNGTLEGTAAPGAVPRADSLQHAAIGATLDSTGSPLGWFDGVVDEARVWNVARTPSEIQAGMTGPIATAPGLVGRWSFDEGLGSVSADSSGAGNDGTLTAGVYVSGTPFAAGPETLADHALDFNGVSSHVAFGEAPELGLATFTLETWFNRRGAGSPATTGDGGVLAIPLLARGRDEGEGDATDVNWFLGLRSTDGVLVADFEDTETGANHPVLGVTPVVPGRWHHAAVVFDGASWSLYLDGALEATAPAAFTPRSDALAPASIGTALDSTGTPLGFFDGEIDEVRVWSTARSSAEIADGLKREITTGTGLVARWGFSEAAGTTVSDPAHPAVAAGTVVDGAWVDGYPFADRLLFLDDTCDGIDQDCDGVPDDGYVPVVCGTSDVGVCHRGTSVCTSGAVSCAGSVEPSAERCDGLDNDCDGQVDEDFALGAACTVGVGACQATGVTVCAPNGAGTVCSAAPGTPTAEVCDGIDNDCDGLVDEDFNVGAACTAGVGACQTAGVFVCNAAQSGTTCNAVPGTPSSEVCDGVDNDCDGQIDEDLGTLTCGVGFCSRTVSACVNGVPQTCVPGAPAVNHALSFDGQDGYVDFGNDASITNFGSGSFTIEEWVRLDDAGPFAGLFRAGRQGANPQVVIQTPGNAPFNRITVSVEDTAQHQIDTVPVTINFGQWYHFAAVVDRSVNEIRVYVDGTLATTSDASIWGGNAIDNRPDATVVGAARQPNGNLSFFLQGALDEVRVWNVARTAAQVQGGRFREIPSAPGLVARWGFGEGSPALQTADSASGGTRNTGTLNGGVAWIDQSGMGTEGTCDGVDNDCDGQVDEDFVFEQTTCGLGVCVATGVTSCVGGVVLDSCHPGTPAADDSSCNGLDDDCDGQVDEDFVGTPISCGVGACGATGQTECHEGQEVSVCEPGRPPSNYGLDLDGASSYVTFGPAPALGLSTFTIEAWFKRQGLGVPADTGQQGLSDAAPLVTKGRGEADGGTFDMNYYLGVSIIDGKLMGDFEDMNGGGNHPLVGATPTGFETWYHAALTYDGSVIRLYLNGQLEASRNENGAVPRFDSIQHAALGSALNTAGVPAGFFDGVIDEARIWNVARTGDEILAGMSGPITTAPNLVARWGLDETGGTTVHDSTGTVNGTLVSGSFVTGTPFVSQPSPTPDHAVELNGRTAYVGIAPTPALGLQTFTLETWFNRKGVSDTTSTGNGGVIAIPLIAKGRGEADGDTRDANYFLGLRSGDNHLVADFEDTSGGVNHPILGTHTALPGAWNHAALTYDGSVLRLYLNGDLDAELLVNRTPRFDSVHGVALGSALDSTGAPAGFFQGEMNEARIWNYARSVADIRASMGAPIPSAPGLVGRWAMTENGGTAIADSAGTPANNGTLVNGTWSDGYPFTDLPVIHDICNGIDDDCDGLVDEDAGVVSCGVGACAVSVQACLNGQPQTCAPGTPTAETCDGIDNDCDGQVDEDFTLGAACSNGIGACQSAGITVCNAAHDGTTCNATPGTPSPETCDGIDNDCDGQIDEDFALGAACTNGVGACQTAGVNVCATGGAGTVCNAVPGSPTPESCDGVDNDCDGLVDEDFNVGAACTNGVGACQAAGVIVCAPGGAGSVCNATPGSPAAEVCDGIDNNCDGQVDEGTQPAEATALVFSNQTTLSWNAAPGAASQNLYRGSFNITSPWAYNEACLQSNLASPTAADAALPPVGTIFVYYAAGQNACGAGSIGVDSGGQARPAPPACP
jgi:hypothetical protein